MDERDEVLPPPGAVVSVFRHRVAFYETDAMGIVHHTNYIRYFENSRIVWLEEHDQPYTTYMETGLNFAVTRVEIDYLASARFDDRIAVTTWIEWARGASLRIAYRIDREAPIAGETPELLVTGATEHASVDENGRVRRIPKEQRSNLQALAAKAKGSRH